MARKTLQLFASNNTLGYRVVRMISPEEGERRAATGAYKPIYHDLTNALLGYQLAKFETTRGDQEMQSQASTASISCAEMRTNAGLEGKSHTAGLPEDLRLERKVPEDHVERVQEKVRVYPFVRSKAHVVRILAGEVCDRMQDLIADGEPVDASLDLDEAVLA
jgi:hypothetical protein